LGQGLLGLDRLALQLHEIIEIKRAKNLLGINDFDPFQQIVIRYILQYRIFFSEQNQDLIGRIRIIKDLQGLMQDFVRFLGIFIDRSDQIPFVLREFPGFTGPFIDFHYAQTGVAEFVAGREILKTK
jgi:hypothetical protein